jgi:hypothetical protein
MTEHSADPSPSEPEPSGEPAAGGEPAAAGEPALPDAPALVMTCLSLLATKAWEAMGLVPNPRTKQIERNLDDAQIAIDAAAALAGVLKPRTAEAERREIETLLANLRINFVEQKSKTP